MPVASVPRRHLEIDLFRDPKSRKKIGRKPVTSASGGRDGLGLQQDLFESLDGAHVGLRSHRAHRQTETDTPKIHVRSGGDPVRGDQHIEARPIEDHHVGRNTACELSADCLGPCSQRRTRSGCDPDAARPLEFRQ
jgi:hypothetical protein